MSDAPGPRAHPAARAAGRGPAGGLAAVAEWARRDTILLGAALAFALLLRAPIAAIPLERDEGEYAYIAQRWLASEIPYRDAFDQKPPGVFVAYAAILRAFGRSPGAIHWGAQVYALGTIALVFALGRRLLGARAGLAAGLVAAFLSAGPGVLGNAANTETFMILPLVAALLATLAAVERDSLRWAAVAGIASGCAVLFKQVALPNLVVCLAFVAWRSPRRAAATVAFLAACAASLAPLPAYFAAAGAWDDFYDCVVGHNLNYAARLPLAVYPTYLGLAVRGLIVTWWPALLLAAAGVFAGFRARAAAGARGETWTLVAAWSLASFAGVATGGYFRAHYFLQIVPAVALFAAAGAEAIAAALPAGASDAAGAGRPAPRSFAPAAMAGAAVLIGLFGATWYFLPGDVDAKCRRIYGTNPFAESQIAARFIARRSNPSDRVFIFGSEPQILFHAARRSATRYIFAYPLMTPFPDTRDRQRAALAEIVENRPSHIVLVFVPTSFLATAGTPQDLMDGLVSILNEGYQVAAVAPFQARSPQDWDVEWVTGQEAKTLWASHAGKPNQGMWCSLAVWERTETETTPEL